MYKFANVQVRKFTPRHCASVQVRQRASLQVQHSRTRKCASAPSWTERRVRGQDFSIAQRAVRLEGRDDRRSRASVSSVSEAAEGGAERRWAEEFASIRQWQRGSERAPHKPLLLLFVMGRLQQTGSSATPFAEAEPDLKRLLAEFGPPRSSSPAYPFHHLRSDGFWSVTTKDGTDPGTSLTELRSSQATGQLSAELEQDAAGNPALISRLARLLLAANWPPTLHTDILDSVGLEIDSPATASDPQVSERRRRDPQFRDRVLVAYEYRCAFCGYDGRLAGDTVALEAAHVQWHSSDGPDSVENALCLCSLHHKLLDLGVMGLTPDHEISVSTRFVGHGDVAELMVLDLVGRPIRAPQPGEPPVEDEFIDWHGAQVFRSPARQTT